MHNIIPKMGTIFIERLKNDWSIERLMDYAIQNIIIHFFEWLKDWKIERLWKFKYMFFLRFERFNHWLIIYTIMFLNDWKLDRLKDYTVFNTYVFCLNDWTIERWNDNRIKMYKGIFWKIEGLNDWKLKKYNIGVVWKIERLNDYGNLNMYIFFERLKDWMDYIIHMMGTYSIGEWMIEWLNALWNSKYTYTFFWMVERLKDWTIVRN